MTTYRIHPAIGIARVGNSKTGYFIGPERPGQAPQESYKEGDKKSILRQGARFRVYEYDEAGKPVREITSAEAEITWKVHLVNRKAAGPKIFDVGDRNPGIPPELLIIDPGERSILGGDPGPLALAGKCLGSDVLLGELRTEVGGQLVVLGGYGRSFSPTGKKLEGTFNNREWCDDTADGRVSASLRFRGQEPVEAQASWVITAPPDFAPPIGNVISLYDVVYDVALEGFGFHHDPLLAAGNVFFEQHVFPLLERTAHAWWVDLTAANQAMGKGHAPGMKGDFLKEDMLKLLRDNNPNPESPAFKVRNQVFARLRKPDGTGGTMPRLNPEYDTGRNPALPAWKYKVMERWAKGDFEPQGSFEPECDPHPFDLDKAALDACVGASFYPGIEAPRSLRDQPELYGAPFRIAGHVPPGLITQGLAVPWQTDFQACSSGWWPAVRPNNVFRDGKRQLWAEGVGKEEMVEKWMRLGFVLPSGVANPPFIEKERDPELVFDLELLLASATAISPEIQGDVR
ncbi:MAG TPA: LodA/GoxA family CTQ-dependent oxidase [Thermoanaerobaculia bacterium]|nr:LodA/GoxA family CTQ-dependent oxidase [Thermoanaerobaculia bacterium]